MILFQITLFQINLFQIKLFYQPIFHAFFLKFFVSLIFPYICTDKIEKWNLKFDLSKNK